MNVPAHAELADVLPPALAPLGELAMNLWWSWDPESEALFAALDPLLWQRSRHNPKALLLDLGAERLAELAEDAALVARAEGCAARLRAYLADTDTWARANAPELAATEGERVAYLSMEFGVHECMRIYSGGLGVLAGDHARSASDLGLGFVGVSLLYRQGYFRQVIDEGHQVAAYPTARFSRLPITLLRDAEGQPVEVEVPHGHHVYRARVWELRVGRVRLLLLDADHEGNPFQHRYYTHQLYGGDSRTRVAQEVLLGVGGMRALEALGIEPAVLHLNEGHTAFAPVEWARRRVLQGATLREALAAVRQRTVFTTHTPVPAGHDRFGWDLVNEALGGYRDDMGWPHGTLMDLGRVRPGDIHEPLCMTVLALRLSRAANGVSALHGEVSREMWRDLYPTALTADEVPIGHVTNGVHPLFFLSPELRALLDARAPGWQGHLTDRAWWARAVEDLPGEALWQAHEAARRALVAEARVRARCDDLDPEVLTIGFARRFAPYKRANLIFSDPERLARLVSGPRPVQLLFAGKAHPMDLHGQALLAEVLRFAGKPELRGRVVFLKEYDLSVGRLLTRGCDVWLNTPRRPREASGTSGMKAAMNGVLNASVLDGWWPEAYDGVNGWAIGEARDYPSEEAQDADDALDLYRVLEDELVPAFYDRDAAGVPREWVRRMRASIATCLPVFNTHRMVAEYTRSAYRT